MSNTAPSRADPWWSFPLADGAHHKKPHSPTHPPFNKLTNWMLTLKIQAQCHSQNRAIVKYRRQKCGTPATFVWWWNTEQFRQQNDKKKKIFPENVICKMAAILFKPQVNCLTQRILHCSVAESCARHCHLVTAPLLPWCSSIHCMPCCSCHRHCDVTDAHHQRHWHPCELTITHDVFITSQ